MLPCRAHSEPTAGDLARLRRAVSGVAPLIVLMAAAGAGHLLAAGVVSVGVGTALGAVAWRLSGAPRRI